MRKRAPSLAAVHHPPRLPICLHLFSLPMPLPQVERVTRESNFYPPERVKTFLMEVGRGHV